MADARIPAHVEVTGLLRAAQAAGGFGMVLAKGERDAGTLLVVCCRNGAGAHAYERMPQPDGTRQWVLAKVQVPGDPFAFSEFCDRRKKQDSDLWIVELDLDHAEKLIGLPAPAR